MEPDSYIMVKTYNLESDLENWCSEKLILLCVYHLVWQKIVSLPNTGMTKKLSLPNGSSGCDAGLCSTNYIQTIEGNLLLMYRS